MHTYDFAISKCALNFKNLYQIILRHLQTFLTPSDEKQDFFKAGDCRITYIIDFHRIRKTSTVPFYNCFFKNWEFYYQKIWLAIKIVFWRRDYLILFLKSHENQSRYVYVNCNFKKVLILNWCCREGFQVPQNDLTMFC